MLDKRDGTPVVDLAVLVASPALIMVMVGSLVWFLVDVLRPTAYPDRLLWCLSFFVFGVVLIARLSIQSGRAYASVYALALGGATFLAMNAFVTYPGNLAGVVGAAVSLGLMGLAWWLADRLTWDCTHLDEDRKTSGRGLLAAAGLDETAPADPVGQDDDAEDPERAARRRRKDAPGLMGWLERLMRYREARRKRPHTPGTWVLYFGLAALPVFALGQSLVSAGDTDRRRATLMEAAAFVGSGLGLLVTTSLMGLRRYLEQRDAKIPAAMTAGWLGLGTGLIVAFIVAAMILPRPHSETPLISLKAAEGSRQASKNAVVRDNSAGKGDGARGQKTEAGKGQQSAPGGKQEGGSGGEKGSGGGKGESQGKGNQSGGQQGKGSQSGDQQGKGEGGRSGSGKQQSGEKSDQRTQPGEKSESKSGGSAGDRQSGADSESSEGKSNGDPSDDGSKASASGPSKLSQAFETAGTALKWLVWIALAIGVIVAVCVYGLRLIAPFTDWAKNLLAWLQGLFARKPRDGGGANDPEEADAGPQRVPFAAFSNPFADGTARRRTPADLATYTLAALDAWAGDHGAGRPAGETPGEFTARLADEFPYLDAAGRAADLAVRALYARGPLPADAPKALAALWKQMEARAAAPTSR